MPFNFAATHRAAADDVFIEVDFSSLVKLKPQYEKNWKEIWGQAGQRHRQYLFKRFIGLSSMRGGGGPGRQWQALAQSTLKTKKYRMKKFGYSGSIHWILRESSRLLHALEYVLYKRGNDSGYYVGYIRDRGHPNTGLTLIQLADLHHKGFVTHRGGRVPARPIVVMPTRAVMRDVVTSIVQGGFNKMINEVNRELRR